MTTFKKPSHVFECPSCHRYKHMYGRVVCSSCETNLGPTLAPVAKSPIHPTRMRISEMKLKKLAHETIIRNANSFPFLKSRVKEYLPYTIYIVVFILFSI